MTIGKMYITFLLLLSSLFSMASPIPQASSMATNNSIDKVAYSILPPINDFVNIDTNRIVVVYIGGEYIDGTDKSNDMLFYNDMKYFYRVMRNGYHIPKENISTLFASGNEHVAEIDSCQILIPISWDLDGDGSNDIVGGATLDRVEELFDSLARNIHADQHLLIVFDVHGKDPKDGLPLKLKLWDGELFIDDLASKLNSVQCATQCVVLNSCFSGSFIPALRKNGRIILTSAKNTTSNGNPWMYNYFIHRWTNAINGLCSKTYGTPDIDNDGYISMLESYGYSSTENIGYPEPYNMLEHSKPAEPMYCSLPQNLGNKWAVNLLPQLSGDLHIRDAENDWGQSNMNTTQVPWQSPDIWIRKGNDGFENQRTEALHLSENDGTVYVYVRVNNNGYNYYNGSGKILHIHWTLPSLRHNHTSWIEHDIPLPISATIDTLSSNIVCYKWNLPKKLRDEASRNNGNLNVEIIARISDELAFAGDEEDTRFPFESSSPKAITANPKLAQLSVIPNTTSNSTATFKTSLFLKQGETTATISAMKGVPRDISVTYSINNHTYVHTANDDRDIEIDGLQVDSIYQLAVSCSVLESRTQKPDTILLPIGVFCGDTLVGGFSFQMNVGDNGRPLYPGIDDSANNVDQGTGGSIDVEGPLFGERVLSMTNIDEPASCEWSDSQGIILGHDNKLLIPFNANGNYKLSVRALRDNATASVTKLIRPISYFKSAKMSNGELAVELRSPVPSLSKLSLRSVSAGIEPIEYSLTTGESNKTINMSSYPSGVYLLSLSVNGQLIETIKVTN